MIQSTRIGITVWSLLCTAFCVTIEAQIDTDSLAKDLNSIEEFVQIYCIDCHSSHEAIANLDLENFDFTVDQLSQTGFDSSHWEKIWRRLQSRQMPPPSSTRPDEDGYQTTIAALVTVLETRAKTFPRPGRTESVRRLTRIEYQNAIRDLLAIEINASDWLPKDESSHGFDNITVSELSPMLLNRYLSAAQKISRMAVGSNATTPSGVTIRLPADFTQEAHVAGLPLGTRGGTVFKHHFPQTGEYEVELRLMRDRDETVEGLNQEHQIDILVDRKRLHQFTVKPPLDGNDYTHSDSHLKTRIQVAAGTRQFGVTFPKKFSSLLETKRQPFDASYNRHRHPRTTPAIFQISIFGPFSPSGADDTASRRLIFFETPNSPDQETECAKKILARLARHAYRKPISDADLETPMRFFEEGRQESGFEAGIEMAISSILVNPNFLFRIESEPTESPAKGFYRISDLELASRLSFFLWSSIPDEELLTLAEEDRLHELPVLEHQVRRMLADNKADSLVHNFAAQWLYLRNLDSLTRDLRLFPDFDDNLRSAFRRETESLFEDVLRNDRSVLDLIQSDYTYLNERLATHYGIPHVNGSHFRKVELPPGSKRSGILRHGSILAVTSYATRTSPTIRGSWILENILGTPTPPPPPDVPTLKDKSSLVPTTVRDRLAQHRANPACASCHDIIDPVGFALENYDALGRWREFDGSNSIDTRATLPDGSEIVAQKTSKPLY